MIRKAKREDLDEVENIFTEILRHEQSHTAYTVWQEGVYPTRKTAEEGYSDGSLYVMERSGKLCASMIVDRVAPDEYGKIHWKSNAAPSEVCMIRLLCVRPSEAGRGLGSEMVEFAIEEARRKNFKAIRLDTGGQNIPAKTLYTKLGFQLVATGSMSVGHIIAHENHLFFEYVLS